MSLVDKLKIMHRGDLVLLRTNGGLEVAGYVQDYGSRKVRLSPTNPFNDISKIGFWALMNIRKFGNTKTYKLKHFSDYEVLRKHSSE